MISSLLTLVSDGCSSTFTPQLPFSFPDSSLRGYLFIPKKETGKFSTPHFPWKNFCQGGGWEMKIFELRKLKNLVVKDIEYLGLSYIVIFPFLSLSPSFLEKSWIESKCLSLIYINKRNTLKLTNLLGRISYLSSVCWRCLGFSCLDRWTDLAGFTH